MLNQQIGCALFLQDLVCCVVLKIASWVPDHAGVSGQLNCSIQAACGSQVALGTKEHSAAIHLTWRFVPFDLPSNAIDLSSCQVMSLSVHVVLGLALPQQGIRSESMALN